MMNNDNISIAGVEIVEEAVELAKINAKKNGIKNYTYISSTAKDILNMVQSNDIIIVDPPRKGLDKKLVDGLIKKDVKNIVYVSCNANTLARDYSIFKENGYILKEISCVDMFPNTIHVECVTMISKIYRGEDMIRYILVKAAKKDIPRLIKYKKDIIYMYNKDLSEDEKNKINEYVTNSVSEMFKDYYNIIFDDKIIGSILLKDIQEGKLIDEIYIEKEFRNNGIGTDIIMKVVKKSNNKNIYLWVYKENIKAVSLYKRLGFKIIDETESRYYMEYNVKGENKKLK